MAMEEDDDLAAALAMSLDPAASGSGNAPSENANSDPSPIDAAILELRAQSSSLLAETGAQQVLTTLLSNLVKSPAEEKFRKIRLGNAKISKALSCPGAEKLLLLVGFMKGSETLEIPPDKPGAEVAVSAQTVLDSLANSGSLQLAAQLRAEGPVRCCCALSSGLATGAMDNVIRLYSAGQWDAPKLLFGHEQRSGVSGVLALTRRKGPSEPPTSVEFASAGRDGKILLWRDGVEISTLKGHGEGVDGTNVHVVSCLGNHVDGALLSGGWDKTVRVWKDGVQISVLQGHTVAVNAVVGLPNGDIASGSGDQSIGIWRNSTRRHDLAAGSPVRALSSCGANLLASGANDGCVRIWDVESGQQVSEMKVANSYILSASFHAEERLLAVGADDGLITILAVSLDGKLQKAESLQLCGEVFGLCFLENGDLAAACGDESCLVWTKSNQRAAPKSVQQDYSARVNALLAARSASGESVSIVGASPGGSSDFSFPVELGGRKMTLHWNRGEEPQDVARRFLAANSLEQSHFSDVVAFIAQSEQQAASGSHGAGGGGGGGGGNYDYSYPVEVADGRRLTISWNRGDDPQTVALNFARQNGGIAANELPDIVSFIQQVSGGPPMVMQQAPASAAPPSVEVQQQMMQQVMEMGFDEATARGALMAAGWSVEAAIQRLFG
eukprot:TRINITY_DN11515_c1_g1_i1.p1 TRINITY_DN11515_c1_g1~~TRINITY_DN11515_c1_g1_i1.p1  ORF type:complete len:670 (+),score=139.43 TRINITY_DN11515_c1_g1_i1:82-2091(+)